MDLIKKKTETNQKISFLINQNAKLLDSLIKSVVDFSNKPIVIVSNNGIVYANRSAVKLIGIPLKSLEGKMVEDIFVLRKGVQLGNVFIKASTLKKKYSIDDLRLKINNGKEYWVSPRIKKCFWKGNNALMLDLQRSRKDEITSTPFEISQDTILQAINIAKYSIWSYNLNSKEAWVNSEFFSALGYHPSEIASSSLTWETILHSESVNGIKQMVDDFTQGKDKSSTWEYRVRDKEGKYRWMIGINQVAEWDKNGKPLKLTGIHFDIDNRKKDEIEKEEYHKILSGFFANAHDGIVVVDENGMIKEWNAVQEQITNIKREQVLGQSVWDIQDTLSIKKEMSSDFFKQLKEVFSTISHTGSNPWEGKIYESTIQVNTGEQKNIQQNIFTIKSDTGIIVAASIKDITESKASHIKVEKSEERLKLAISAGNVGVWDYDFKTCEIYISPTAFTILGYLPREFEPTEDLYKSIVHPDSLDEVSQKIKTLLISGSFLETETRARKKNGDYIWILSKNRIIRDEHGEKLRASGTITDITRQKNIELELRQSQKDLTKNLKQHEILSEISYVLNTNKDFHWKNKEVLRLLGSFTDASRVYIFENVPDKNITVNTYEWCNTKIVSEIDNLQDVSIEVVEQGFKGRDYLASSNIKEDLSQEFAQMLISQDIQSFLVFPLRVSGKHFGYIGFDECTYKRVWGKSEIELLKTISNLISFSFERELVQRHYQLNEQRYRELTEKLPQIIFEVSNKGKIDFLNQTGCDFFGVSKMQVKEGIFVWNLFPLREVVKMRTLLNYVTKATELEPIRLEAKTADKSLKPMVFYIRPRMEGREIINFSGIALQPEG